MIDRTLFAVLLGIAVGCAGSKESSDVGTVADTVPTPDVCGQVKDHVSAYVVYGGCLQPNGKMGYFPAIGERDPLGARCTSPNTVGELAYRSPEIDAAVFDSFSTHKHDLTIAVDAIWLACVAGRRPGGVDSETRELDQAKLRRMFWAVPAVSDVLVDEIADRVGQPSGCGREGTAPQVASDTIDPVLTVMRDGLTVRKGKHKGRVLHGLHALTRPESPPVDPNLAVAIGRVQRGDRGRVPTFDEVVAALDEMGVEVVP